MDYILNILLQDDPTQLDTLPLTVVFVKVLTTAVVICLFQLSCFAVARPFLPQVFQPRATSGLAPWWRRIKPWCDYSDSQILATMGLDAYFIIRYLRVLFAFFLLVGAFTTVVLVPITLSANPSMPWLHRLNLANIPPELVARYHGHSLMVVVVSGLFMVMTSHELRHFHEIKRGYMAANVDGGSSTVLFSNVPPSWLNPDRLVERFSSVGTINSIHFVENATAKQHWRRVHNHGLFHLEKGLVDYTRTYLRRHCRQPLLWNPWRFVFPKIEPRGHVHQFEVGCEVERWMPVQLGRWSLPGWLLFKRKQDPVQWGITQIKLAENMIKHAQGKLHDKVFITFSTTATASICFQCDVSPLVAVAIGVEPQSVAWENMAISQARAYAQTCISHIVMVVVTVIYVFPVMIIGVVFSIPFLTTVLPFTKWFIKLFPGNIQEAASGLAPAIALLLLSHSVGWIFRQLAERQGVLIHGQVEITLQRCYFWFLWIQQFLVVTILALVVVLIRKVLKNPAVMVRSLAQNLPRALIFYFHFFVTQAWGMLGNHFFQVLPLISHAYYRFCRRSTPRQWWLSQTLPQQAWGAAFAQMAVYGCISLSYLVISPVVSLLFVVVLKFTLIGHRYNLKYVLDPVNRSETQGSLYPRAIFHLYLGAYCLQVSFIAFCFTHSTRALVVDGWLVVVLLLVTLTVHAVLYGTHHRRSVLVASIFTEAEVISELEPGYYDPTTVIVPTQLWLPLDPLGISRYQLKYLEHLVGLGSVKNAKLEYQSFDMPCSTNGPPPPP